MLVTGASSGLGRATVAGLARLGARVHLVGRSTERLRSSADLVREELRNDVPDAELVLRECDISDLDAVAALVATLSEELVALHALVHCAGLVPEQRTTSAQGHELALATHVLGPFALTAGLRELLHADGDGRVVFVSSGGLYPVPAVSRDLEYRDGE